MLRCVGYSVRRVATAAVCAIVFAGAAPSSAHSFTPIHHMMTGGGGNVAGGPTFTPLGGYVFGSVFVAAAAPIIGTIVLNRELTTEEVWHTTLSAFLGPVGWIVADQMFAPGSRGNTGAAPERPAGGVSTASRTSYFNNNISVPPPGATDFVPDEILLEFTARASAQQIARMESRLQLELLETQTFELGGHTYRRYRIRGGTSVRAVLLALRHFGVVRAAQPNNYFLGQQTQTTVPSVAPADTTQYVIEKMNLLQAHRVSSGDDVLIAVIDSQIDLSHPDLVGAFAGEYDLIGKPETPHGHGTAMAGAIAAHSKLIGVAPKVRVLAVRAFAGGQENARGTTFNILKGLDWAAAKKARIFNMSFAGPFDPMLRVMLASAYARGMVLIAAVGNAGPRSPPLYPAADRHVIGVTATDANDNLLPSANRGPQVTVAAPGVDILADAPDGAYQITSGTSIAAAHASGVAALLLARDPRLTPSQIRRALIRSARKIPGRQREVGAGVIDALAAVREFVGVQ